MCVYLTLHRSIEFHVIVITIHVWESKLLHNSETKITLQIKCTRSNDEINQRNEKYIFLESAVYVDS